MAIWCSKDVKRLGTGPAEYQRHNRLQRPVQEGENVEGRVAERGADSRPSPSGRKKRMYWLQTNGYVHDLTTASRRICERGQGGMENRSQLDLLESRRTKRDSHRDVGNHLARVILHRREVKDSRSGRHRPRLDGHLDAASQARRLALLDSPLDGLAQVGCRAGRVALDEVEQVEAEEGRVVHLGRRRSGQTAESQEG